MADLTPTKYKCTECGETDSDRATYEPSPVALICAKCGAGAFTVKDGRGQRMASPFEQLQAQVGMLPVQE